MGGEKVDSGGGVMVDSTSEMADSVGDEIGESADLKMVDLAGAVIDDSVVGERDVFGHSSNLTLLPTMTS
jgi:hypothetical protein